MVLAGSLVSGITHEIAKAAQALQVAYLCIECCDTDVDVTGVLYRGSGGRPGKPRVERAQHWVVAPLFAAARDVFLAAVPARER